MLDSATSASIVSLYPTQYEWLRRCPLHVALEQHRRAASGGHRRKTDPQRLGDVIHRVMYVAVKEEVLVRDDWRSAVEAAWDAAVAAEVAADRTAPEPARWANYEEKRQRALRLAERVRSLVIAHGPRGFHPEEHLVGRGGRLKGIADLVVRTKAVHMVIDYKTGNVASSGGEHVNAAYDRQLKLYAALEAETSGSWPEEVAVYPLKGLPIELQATPEACDAAAADAINALDAYNAVAPGPQDARPAPEACAICDFAPSCPAFWAAIPMDGVIAAEGTVAEVFLAERGGVSVAFDQADGTRLQVLAILPAFHPAAALTTVGDHVRFVGLREKDEMGYFGLPPSGLMSVTSGS